MKLDYRRLKITKLKIDQDKGQRINELLEKLKTENQKAEAVVK